MARKRKKAGRVGESVILGLAVLTYFTYPTLIKFPLLASFIFGIIFQQLWLQPW